VKQSLDDMASDIPEIQARGRQRLIGFTSVAAVAPVAIFDLASAVTGVGQDVMDAYKRSFGAPWEKGSVLIPMGYTEDGKLQFANFSTSNPYDSLFRFANRMITELDTAAEVGKDPGQAAFDVVVGTLGEFFAPFLSEAMLTEALIDISLRGGRTATGARVYNPADSWNVKGEKMFMHVVDTMLPNLIPVTISGGVAEPSRFLRGVVGGVAPGLVDPMDKLGRERNAQTELLRQITGLTVQEFDPKKGLEFGAFRMQQGQTNARSIFNTVTDDFNATSDRFLDAYVRANEAKFRIDRQYFQMIEDLRTLGMSNQDIRRVLRQNNVSGAKGILRGEFEPFDITPNNLREMRRAGTIDRFPRQEINEIRRSLRNLPLDQGPVSVEPRPAPSAAPIVDPFQQGAAQPPAVAPSAPPIVDPFRQTAAQPRPTGPISPALLGDTPAEQAANMQIAQATGRA